MVMLPAFADNAEDFAVIADSLLGYSGEDSSRPSPFAQ